MAYLRSAPSTPEHPTIIPRAVQLIFSSSSRLEALLELRDEASYLGLDELQQLCNAEIRHRESMLSHTHVGSTGSGPSVQSLHTFRDRPSSESHGADEFTVGARRDSIVTHKSAPQERDGARSMAPVAPAPAASHSRSRSRTVPLRSPPICAVPPPGWI
jgi:hypothetical protein